ncbi:MAG: GCN5 family acetyltransferase [Gordonia sp. (in: high G+C Gram-positive bacteria)]
MHPAVGDRIVVRYRLGAGGPDDWRAAPNPTLTDGPSLSDITGVLLSMDDQTLVVERDGRPHDVPRSAITSIRQLSRRVVRNSQIRDVERVLSQAWGPTETLDGWVLTGRTGPAVPRAASATPLEFGADGRAVDAVRAWYTARDLPPVALLPDRLTTGGAFPAPNGPAYEVLTADTPTAGTAELRVRADDDAVTLVLGELNAVEVRADDEPARAWWRLAGFDLHHTYRLTAL